MGGHGKDYGITFRDRIIDFSKLIARKEIVVKTLVQASGCCSGKNWR